jgi:uncharacterized protein
MSMEGGSMQGSRSITSFTSPSDQPVRRERTLELAVFLFLIVPSMVVSFFAVQGGLPFPLVAGSTIARDLSLVALVFFLVRNAGERFASIGWTRHRLGRELMVGVALFPAVFLGSVFVERAMRTAGFTGSSTPQPDLIPAPDLVQLLLAVALVAVVAISEETIFRGYLMMRIGQTTGSVASAVVLSAFIFSLGHGYEGTAGVVTVGLTGAVLGLVYRWRGSIVAPVVIHFLLDLVAIVIVPLAFR